MLTVPIAEFKGPGVHHHFDDSDEYGMDHDQHSQMLSSRGGRVILLGNGGQFHTEGDSDMFDQSDEEEKDLESQVPKTESKGADRSMRGETPGPESASSHIENSTGTPTEPNMSAANDGPAKDS